MRQSAQGFLEQAGHNRRVADALLQGKPPISRQWAVTCLFYAALHYVNAHVSSHGQPVPADHGARDLGVSRFMRSVYPAYRWLRTRSEAARYGMRHPGEQELEESRRRADAIESFVAKRLRRAVH
jgi:hypothetical protein